MRLHVRVIGTEQFLGAVYGQLFGLIDEFAATVVTFAGITLGVFIGQLRALRFHDPRAAIVFRGDQFDMIFLTPAFFFEGLE